MRFCYAHRRFTLHPQRANYSDLQPDDYTDSFLKMVKRIGFDALEVGVEVLDRAGGTESTVRDFSKRIESYGLQIGSIRSGGSIADAKIGRNNRKKLLRAIEEAGWAGAEVVNGSLSAPARLPGNPPGSLPASGSGWMISQDASRDAMLWVYEHLADFYRQATHKAGEHGVNISIEVHQNSPVDNSWSALMLHEMVGMPNFGINPDIGNMVWNYDLPEEDLDDAITLLAPVANYWHCKNFLRVYQPENNRSFFLRVPLQDGILDYRFAVSEMASAGYTGYMAIEGAWAGDQWYADRKSLEYAKELWSEAEQGKE